MAINLGKDKLYSYFTLSQNKYSIKQTQNRNDKYCSKASLLSHDIMGMINRFHYIITKKEKKNGLKTLKKLAEKKLGETFTTHSKRKKFNTFTI